MIPIFTEAETEIILREACEAGDVETEALAREALESREGATALARHIFLIEELEAEYEAAMRDPDAGAMRGWPR